MAIVWILATFFGVVGVAWFIVMAFLGLVHLRQDKMPAIIAALCALICVGFTIEAAGQVRAEYEKIMETIERQN